LLVTDHAANQVKVFDHTGRLLRKLGAGACFRRARLDDRMRVLEPFDSWANARVVSHASQRSLVATGQGG
jgi:hypothetical protein